MCACDAAADFPIHMHMISIVEAHICAAQSAASRWVLLGRTQPAKRQSISWPATARMHNFPFWWSTLDDDEYVSCLGSLAALVY